MKTETEIRDSIWERVQEIDTERARLTLALDALAPPRRAAPGTGGQPQRSAPPKAATGRLRVLRACTPGPTKLREVRTKARLAQTVASRHLRALEADGLVERSPQGWKAVGS